MILAVFISFSINFYLSGLLFNVTPSFDLFESSNRSEPIVPSFLSIGFGYIDGTCTKAIVMSRVLSVMSTSYLDFLDDFFFRLGL
jgi:hypothetical protein